ncbi:type VII secretion protein EssB [Furfurilactobacillus sp. WILCCON 0119]
MNDVTITLGDDKYPLHFEQNTISIELSKGRIKSDNRQLLEMTLTNHPHLLPGQLIEGQDSYTWQYRNTIGGRLLVDMIKELSRSDKLRLLENLADLVEFTDSRLTVFLHPDNLLFTDSLTPLVIHRGLEDIVPPLQMGQRDFLRQYKSFVIFLMTPQYDYMDLYQGTLEDVKQTPFNAAVLRASTVAELHDFLTNSYREEHDRVLHVETVIPKRRARFFQTGFYVLASLVVILVGTVLYYSVNKVPYDNRLMTSQKDYLATDYDQVITDLKGDNPDKLPKTEQYILASSYINVESLSNTQKKNVLKNVTLKSDQSYLKYWIYNGRGDFSKALNIAQYINDDQLILYTYTKLYDQVNADPKLSGSQKQAQRSKYQKQIDKYESKLGGAKNGFGN